MDRDDSGAVDWDAAFEAIVAPLRPSRLRRVARATGHAVLTALLVATTWWVLYQVMSAQVRGLGHPWR